jgi:3-hydroxyisobutyrate dehydrogenase-like beta-hydroxyacid dehydrogenase
MALESPVIGFIGFGEVAYYLSLGLAREGVEQIVAYDIGAQDPNHGQIIRHRAHDAGVKLAASGGEVLQQADIVISAVHGHVAVDVAREAARFAQPGQLFADLNNSAPSAKREASEAIQVTGAQFVDIGLFETPARAGHKALMLASGDGAAGFQRQMAAYGMNIQVVAGDAGWATAIKTLANIYYKGVQALYLEVALCARQAGVSLDLLAPLLVQPAGSLPRDQEMAFWIVRSGLHAGRKKAEAREIARAIEEWGLEPIMTHGAARRFELLAAYGLQDHLAADSSPEQVEAMLDAMARIGSERGIPWR